MKVGKFEGTPEEIRNLFIGNDLQLADYLEKPEEPLKTIWFVIPAILFACAECVLVIESGLPKSALSLVFLFGGGSVVWLAIAIQVRYKNPWATTVAAIGGLLMLLVAAGFMAPKDTVDAIQALKNKGQ
jgi:hypothetical protein